jgi:hypothetical protein
MLDAGEKLTSDALTLVGPRAVQDQTYLQYSGQNLKAGAVLAIQLDDLDKMKFTSPDSSDASDNPAALPSAGDLSQTALLWLVMALGGIALVLGLAYPRLRPHLKGEVATASQASDPALERQRLLLTLARLDQAYQAGRLNETVYRRARARRKAELIELMRRGEGS